MSDILKILGDLSTCLCTGVQEATGQNLCWCGVYPGGVPAWEYCGECDSGACGMGYVSLVNTTRYTVFGQPLTDSYECAAGTQLSVVMGVLRCLPVHADGSAPDPGEMAVVAAGLLRDMDAMRYAADCCYKGDVIMVTYESLPPNGGCLGGQWTVVVDAM